MLRLLLALLRGPRSALRSHAGLRVENLALRQQLAAFAHSGRRPRIVAIDRLFWIALRRLWSRRSDVLVFVKPETVIRRHRTGFRRYWRWISRHRASGRPTLDPTIRDLIRRMVADNRAMRDIDRIATAALRDATRKKRKLVERETISRALAADGRSAD